MKKRKVRCVFAFQNELGPCRKPASVIFINQCYLLLRCLYIRVHCCRRCRRRRPGAIVKRFQPNADGGGGGGGGALEIFIIIIIIQQSYVMLLTINME